MTKNVEHIPAGDVRLAGRQERPATGHHDQSSNAQSRRGLPREDHTPVDIPFPRAAWRMAWRAMDPASGQASLDLLCMHGTANKTVD
jgi:hypothetical protein